MRNYKKGPNRSSRTETYYSRVKNNSMDGFKSRLVTAEKRMSKMKNQGLKDK